MPAKYMNRLLSEPAFSGRRIEEWTRLRMPTRDARVVVIGGPQKLRSYSPSG
jgi:hypothetical protein